MTLRHFALAAIILTIVAIGTAHAQSSTDQSSPAPTIEPAGTTSLHLYAGLWNLEDGNKIIGGQISRRRRSGIATVFGFDAGRSGRRKPYTQMTAALCFTGPPGEKGEIPFVTIGLASATGLTYDTSPMVSFGFMQGPDPFLKTRFEFQWFARGHDIRDRSRLLIGFVVTP